MNTTHITDTLKITHDSYGNFQPFVYDPGGEEITAGPGKGGITKPRWVSQNRYYPRLSMALDWCLENGLVDENLTLEGDLTLSEALAILEAIDKKRDEFRGMKL